MSQFIFPVFIFRSPVNATTNPDMKSSASIARSGLRMNWIQLMVTKEHNITDAPQLGKGWRRSTRTSCQGSRRRV